MTTAAFTWTEKGSATLRSLECDCGEEFVKDPSDIVEIDDETTIECECGRTYTPEFMLKLVPDSQREQTGYVDVEALSALAEDAKIEVTYTASIGGNTKGFGGNVTGVSQEGIKIAGDDGEPYLICREGHPERPAGIVLRDDWKIGEFEKAITA